MNKDTMKKSELQDIIREALLEVIDEGAAEDKNAQTAALNAEKSKIAALNKKKQELTSQQVAPVDKPGKDAEVNAVNKNIQAAQIKLSKLSKPGMSSTELDEMANVGIRYQLADDVTDEQITAMAGKKAKIVAAIKAAGSAVSKMNVAGEMGYDKQNPINKDFMELVDAGIIVPSEEQIAQRPTTRPTTTTDSGEETTAGGAGGFSQAELDALGISGKEEMSDEEVDASFAAAKASGEDEEPEMTDFEKATSDASSASDVDYEAWLQHRELERRLAATKSNILKLKRAKGTAGDINDRPSDELTRLRALKTSLDDRIAKIEAEHPKLAKTKPTEEPEIENPTTEEEPIDEAFKSRLQYYAGIKK
jgi:hypothetical protein